VALLLFLFLESEEIRHVESKSRTNDDLLISLNLQLLISYVLFELGLYLLLVLIQGFITIFIIVAE
jgi:hypothetical protein